MLNKVAYLPIENKAPGTPGSHVAWLDWTGGGNAQNELSRELTLPGTLGDGFTEGFQTANPYKNNVVELKQDWVNGFTGVKGGDADKVSDLLGVRILLPIYESAQGSGGNVQYRWQQTGLFKIIGFELASLNSNSAKDPRGMRPPNPDGKYLMLEYLGDASEGLATNCSTTAP